MSSRSFRSVFMVASCAGAALSCYLVSLRVASERAALEDVETKIVLAQRDMRVLQTEIGTRGRLSQLERWNAGAFALSAPSADQFLKGSFELARLAQPEHKVEFQAPVVLASAPAPTARSPVGEPATDDSGAPQIAAASQPAALLHQASLRTETREVPARSIAALPQATAKSTDKPATAAKPVPKKSLEKSDLAAAERTDRAGKETRRRVAEAKPQTKKPHGEHDLASGEHARAKAANVSLKMAEATSKPARKKSVDKAAVASAKPVTKPVRIARVDPLAPLPARHSGHSKDVSAD